jgi:hypothetical protein
MSRATWESSLQVRHQAQRLRLAERVVTKPEAKHLAARLEQAQKRVTVSAVMAPRAPQAAVIPKATTVLAAVSHTTGNTRDAPGSDALPSMEDEESVAAGGGGMGEPSAESGGAGIEGAGGAAGGIPGIPGGMGSGGSGAQGQGEIAAGGQPGTGQGAGGSSGAGDGATGSGTYGRYPAGQGTLTPGEQVAILDAELERGMGDFDAMILEEQAAQRRANRDQTSNEPVQTASAGSASGSGEAGDDYGREIGGGGGYSVGGGMGGTGGGGGSIPQNTAKYPPPADIPNGNNDDVVARQLREAAMREPDPAVREKLWVEYRKYTGIKQP